MTQCVSGSAAELSLALDAGARIRARHIRELPELERPDALRLARVQLAALAAHGLVVASAERVVELANRAGIEVVLLKHAALWLGDYLIAGSREPGDLDVLVRPGDAAVLRQLLLAEGYRESGFRDRRHHLASLISSSGEVIEVHTRIPHTGFDLSRLVNRGLVDRCELGCWRPKREILIAHAIVHGYVQHAARPSDYPPLRMLMDCADLGATADDVSAVHAHVSDAMTHAEVSAIVALCEALVGGRDVDLDSAEGRILRHLIAAATDVDYQQALGLYRFRRLRSRSGWTDMVRRACAPTRADLELEHGPIESDARRLWLGILHPLRAAGTVPRSVIAHVRLQLRAWRASW